MNEQLYKLLQKAREDAELRKRIWAVKEAKDPALALCELCTAEGFPLTVGGLFISSAVEMGHCILGSPTT